MDLAGYVINAVLIESRSVTDVCAAHDSSRSGLYELIARYRELGDEGLRPGSKRPGSWPTRVSLAVEEQIVALRKELTDLGVDAGAPRRVGALLRPALDCQTAGRGPSEGAASLCQHVEVEASEAPTERCQ